MALSSASASALVKGRSCSSPSRKRVRPTGTMAAVCAAGARARRSLSVLSSCSPSFQPGHTTIWQWNRMPASFRRVRRWRMSPAKRLFIIRQRSAGSVACTLTYSGEAWRRMMRSSSWSFTLVRVTKFPIIRDNRQSSSFTYRDLRSPGRIWSIKQKTQWFLHTRGLHSMVSLRVIPRGSSSSLWTVWRTTRPSRRITSSTQGLCAVRA